VSFIETKVIVKIGDGVPVYKELLAELDSVVPPEVSLQVVSEAGTNKPAKMDKHRRGLRDIASAIRIVGREGYTYKNRRAKNGNEKRISG
jgi:hypothetical protein